MFILNSTLKGTTWEALLQRKPAECLPGASLGTLPLPSPGTSYAMCLYALLPQGRAEIFAHRFTCQCFARSLRSFGECKSHRGGSSHASAWQWGRNIFKGVQVLLDPVPRIPACGKSLVQSVWLGPGSLPWLRAATAGTGSSL